MKKLEIVVKKTDKVLKVLEKQCPDIVYSAFVSALRQKDVIVDGESIKENLPVLSGSKVVA